MNNEDNPYYNLIQIIKAKNNAGINYVIGQITSAEPLLIQIDSLQLDRQDILINKSLITKSANFKIDAQSVNGNVITEHGGTLESFSMQNGKIEKLDADFVIGDKVLLLISSDMQQFILICKVV